MYALGVETLAISQKGNTGSTVGSEYVYFGEIAPLTSFHVLTTSKCRVYVLVHILPNMY